MAGQFVRIKKIIRNLISKVPQKRLVLEKSFLLSISPEKQNKLICFRMTYWGPILGILCLIIGLYYKIILLKPVR